MVEHVGSVNIDAYAASWPRCCKPGGRLLNHGIARLRYGDAEAGAVLRALRLPGRRARCTCRGSAALERAGLHVRHVEDFPEDYVEDAATSGASASRPTSTARASSPAMSACASGGSTCACRASGFDSGFISIYQVRAEKPLP